MIRDQSLIEARTTAIVEQIVQEFDMGYTVVTVRFDGSDKDADRVVCEATVDFEYRQASLSFNLRQLATIPDQELEDIIVHEMVHIMTAPLWESLSSAQQSKYFKLNELATENVARVLSHIRKETACPNTDDSKLRNPIPH